MPNLQRMRDELALKVASGILVRQDLLKLRNPVGELVIKALDDEQHPLAAQLQELRELIDLHRERDKPRSSKKTGPPKPDEKAVMSDMHFFMPDPGIGLPVRKFWPLQLPLYETARSTSWGGLASRLDVDPEDLAQHVQNAHELRVGIWSVLQHGDHLLKALAHLDYPEPPLRLQGGKLVYGGQETNLSAQQAAFVQLLIDNSGKWVSHSQFANRGIRNPVKILHSLKIKASGINLPIHSKAGAYQLVDIV